MNFWTPLMEILVSEGMSEGAWPFPSKKLTRKFWSGPTSGESLIHIYFVSLTCSLYWFSFCQWCLFTAAVMRTVEDNWSILHLFKEELKVSTLPGLSALVPTLELTMTMSIYAPDPSYPKLTSWQQDTVAWRWNQWCELLFSNNKKLLLG